MLVTLLGTELDEVPPLGLKVPRLSRREGGQGFGGIVRAEQDDRQTVAMGRQRWADLLTDFEARPKPEPTDTIPAGPHGSRVGDEAEEMLPPFAATQDEDGLEPFGA